MINKVILLGRLGKDPEVKRFDNGGTIANFTMATTEKFKDREGNRQERTEWHNVTILRSGLAEVAEKYVTKGQLLYVEGRIRTRSWDDQSGNKRYTTEVVCDNFQMLGGRPDGQNNINTNASTTSTVTTTEAAAADVAEDDLPF